MKGLSYLLNMRCRYRSLGFSPRWPVTPYKELRYFSGYEISGDVVDVRYILTDAGDGGKLMLDTIDEDENAYNYIFEKKGLHFHTSIDGEDTMLNRLDKKEPLTILCYCEKIRKRKGKE